MSHYQQIDPIEFEKERKVEFAPDSFEFVRFPQKHEWKIRNVLPVNFENYCAVVTPWSTYIKGETYCFDGLHEAYKSFGLPLPQPLTLDAWHNDFSIMEQEKILPALLRDILNRFSNGADCVFVRCDHDPDVFNWKIERTLFFQFPDPFDEMPVKVGDFQIFPRGVKWYMHSRDDEPLVYLATNVALISELERALGDRVIRLTLDDRYY